MEDLIGLKVQKIIYDPGEINKIESLKKDKNLRIQKK